MPANTSTKNAPSPTIENHLPTPQPSQHSAPSTQNSSPIPFSTLFPPGQLTLLLGDPGTGKSLIATHLAARITRGMPLLPPSNDMPPKTSVAFLSHEDDFLIRATRLLAAGGILDNARAGPGDRATLCPPSDPSEFSPIVDHIRRYPPALLVLDPLPAYLGTFDCNQPATIRRLLLPLLNAAHRTAVVGILHHNKSRRAPHHSLLHSAAGSHAYTALARSVLHITSSPPPNLPPFPTQHFELSTQHCLTPIKCNNAPLTHTYPFSIRGIAFKSDYSPPGMNIVPIIQWHTPIPLQQSQHSELSTDHFDQSQLDLACDFLRTALANGPLPAAKLQKQARSLAISPRTLSRASRHVPLRHTHDGVNKSWYVSLTKTPTPQEGVPSWEI